MFNDFLRILGLLKFVDVEFIHKIRSIKTMSVIKIVTNGSDFRL